MTKPNPLNSLWIGFKIFTGVIAQFLGIMLLVGSVLYLGTEVGLWCLVVGLFSYYFSKNLERTMVLEEKAKGDDDDEGPNIPIGFV